MGWPSGFWVLLRAAPCERSILHTRTAVQICMLCSILSRSSSSRVPAGTPHDRMKPYSYSYGLWLQCRCADF